MCSGVSLPFLFRQTGTRDEEGKGRGIGRGGFVTGSGDPGPFTPPSLVWKSLLSQVQNRGGEEEEEKKSKQVCVAGYTILFLGREFLEERRASGERKKGMGAQRRNVGNERDREDGEERTRELERERAAKRTQLYTNHLRLISDAVVVLAR